MTLEVVLQQDVISRDAQRPDGRLGSFSLGRSRLGPPVLFEGLVPTPLDFPYFDTTDGDHSFAPLDFDNGA